MASVTVTFCSDFGNKESEEELKSLLRGSKRRVKKLPWNSTLKRWRSLHLVHHVMANRWGSIGNGERLFFWGGSHEIKRRLLLERKALTNLDSILKSRDITLPTKVSIIKAMFVHLFVFQYSCMAMRVGLWRWMSTKELMLLNSSLGENS